ncbi:MAG: TetR/AcrR family transcriptional regulator [Spirochaetaceae bacterium]|jgi:AcrR family transcriptional regulator|nr:TetR/AcrR family transcriptional regulator [Spirochaetaceae bacterium]
MGDFMSITVEHDKRRREILEKALDVFVDEGFENATILKIAARCGITRTTMYIYFKNKKEIFTYSIKHLMGEVEETIQEVRKTATLSSVEKIIRVLNVIIDKLGENRRLLTVILDYLLYLSRNNSDPDQRVRKRTLRLRHILANMVIDGVKAGEFAPVNVRAADDLLYGLLESAIFRFTVLKRDTVSELKEAVELAVRRLCV